MLKKYKDIKLNNEIKQDQVVLKTKVNSDDSEVITTEDINGNRFELRYIKSFTAKLSQANDETTLYYNIVKNHALSYKKANSRISWNYDTINVGRDLILKFAIRGKTLCVYYALNEVDDKYKVERIKSKKYEDAPFLYRIKNDRRCEYAKELVDIAMRRLRIQKGKESHEDFSILYEDTQSLIAKGLIKEFKKKLK